MTPRVFDDVEDKERHVKLSTKGRYAVMAMVERLGAPRPKP